MQSDYFISISKRLNHLRFFAATLIVLFHSFHRMYTDVKDTSPIISLIEEGHTAIGLFLVLSGFTLTVLVRNHDISYSGFLFNRFLRIYPLMTLAVFLQLFHGTYNEHRNYTWTHLVGWLVPFRSETVGLASFFPQIWTLWVEFQLYLLFPFLLHFLRSYGKRYILGLICFFLLLRLVYFCATGEVRYLSYETVFGRLDQFLIGIVLGRLFLDANVDKVDPPKIERRFGFTLFAFAALILILSIHWFNRKVGYTNLVSSHWIWWPTFEGAVWGCILWSYLSIKIFINSKFLAFLSKSLSWGGVVSFSIYIFHNLIIEALLSSRLPLKWARDGYGAEVLFGLLAVMPAVIIFAIPSFFIIERPFLLLKRKYIC